MNKIKQRIKKIKKEKRLGLMTHTVFGYPTVVESKKIAQIMAEEGADFIEIQIPFSDPVADGPTIMRANQIALEQNTKVCQAIEFMNELSKKTDAALLFMSYFNIIYKYGTEKFCIKAKQAGCSGLIVPDIPLDEEPHEKFIDSAEKNNLIAIRVLSPASSERRLLLNATLAKGFAYLASHKGITGTKASFGLELDENIKNIKKFFNIPIAVGFGISEPEHIQFLKRKADIAVVGSAALKAYSEASETQKNYKLRLFIRNLVNSAK